MTDPLDACGDALRRALHTEADAVVPAPDGLVRIRTFVCDPYALDEIRARVHRRRWYRHGALTVASLLVLDALLLLLTLGGS